MSEEPRALPGELERLQEILLSYVEAAESGTAPDRQTFIAAHLEFAEEIVDFLSTYHDLHQMAAPERVEAARLSGLEELRSTAPHKECVSPRKVCASPAEAVYGTPSHDLGQLGDYRLLREIGRGGMGVVYEAEQIS